MADFMITTEVHKDVTPATAGSKQPIAGAYAITVVEAEEFAKANSPIGEKSIKVTLRTTEARQDAASLGLEMTTFINLPWPGIEDKKNRDRERFLKQALTSLGITGANAVDGRVTLNRATFVGKAGHVYYFPYDPATVSNSQVDWLTAEEYGKALAGTLRINDTRPPANANSRAVAGAGALGNAPQGLGSAPTAQGLDPAVGAPANGTGTVNAPAGGVATVLGLMS